MSQLQILDGGTYLAKIKEELKKPGKVRMAVAFLGRQSAQLLSHKATDEIEILCDTSMGVTDAIELERLIDRFGKDRVRKVLSLHSKIFIFSDGFIVGSANLSENALGGPISSQQAPQDSKVKRPKHWEIGVYGNDSVVRQQLIDVFDALKKEAGEIDEFDLKELNEQNRRRRMQRGGNQKGAEIDLATELSNGSIWPLINWWSDESAFLAPKTDREKIAGKFDKDRNGNTVWFLEKDAEYLIEKLPYWVFTIRTEEGWTGVAVNRNQRKSGAVIKVETIFPDSVPTNDGEHFCVGGTLSPKAVVLKYDFDLLMKAFRYVLDRDAKMQNLLFLDKERLPEEKSRIWTKEGYYKAQLRDGGMRLKKFWMAVGERMQKG
jgi:hypothetical protein